MRIEIMTHSSKNTGVRSMRVEHNGREVCWDTIGYQAASINNRDQLFTDINLLLESQPLHVQDEIFSIYVDIDKMMRGDDEDLSGIESMFDTETGYLAMNEKLIPMVNRLYEALDYKHFRNYVYQSGNVQFLPGLKTEYADKDHWTKDFQKRTYLKPDYIELVIVILGLRLMVPVWGAYLSFGKEHTGNEYKEYVAFSLIQRAAIYSWPGMTRLLTYVEATVADTPASLPMVLGGLSTLQLPKYLTGLVMLRKLSIATISARVDDDDHIKMVYNFVRGTLRRLDGSMGGKIGSKVMPKEGGSGDDNSAITDMWKINEETRSGDISFVEAYSKNIYQMADRICPGIDTAKIDACLALIDRIEALHIQFPQTTLTRWIVGKSVISPHSPPVISIPDQARYLIVTQAVLWEWGFHQLAVLATAEPISLDDAGGWAVQEIRSKISKQLMEQLDGLYPHFRRETRASERDKRVNHTARAIELFVSECSNWVWRSRAPKEMASQVGNITPMGQLILTSDIRNQLAQLVLKINQD